MLATHIAQTYGALEFWYGLSCLSYFTANSVPLQLWDLLEGKKLFKVANPKVDTYEYDDQSHLAHITALLGPPPRELLTSGRRASMFYKSDGMYISHAIRDCCQRMQSGELHDPDLTLDGFSFEKTIASIHGEEKRRFIQFVKKMIKWDPKQRSTAKELLNDPWLYTDFPQN